MNKKIIAIILVLIIALILLFGILYFINLFGHESVTQSPPILEAFQEKRERITSKRVAYDTFLNDNRIRAENVSVNLHRIFTDSIDRQQEAEKCKKIIQYAPLPIPSHKASHYTNNKAAPDSVKDSSPTIRKREGFYTNAITPVKQMTPTEFELKASIHCRQTVTTGSLVMLYTNESAYLDGKCILQNSLLYGLADLSGDRVRIHIQTIRHADSIQQVNLSVFDKDGLEGIYIPGLTVHQTVKESENSLLEQASVVNVPYIGQLPLHSISSQAAAPDATLTDGYQVILRIAPEHG